jgi:hypothetical protein
MKFPLAIVILALVIAFVQTNGAQVVVPPTASLDVQIPVAPTPVKIGGRWNLAYELHVTNYRSVDVVLTRIKVVTGVRDETVLASYDGKALVDRLARVGTRADRSDPRIVGPGKRVVMFTWLDFDVQPSAASVIRHRISYEVRGETGVETATLDGVPAVVRDESPVVLSPPLRGGPWAALYDPESAAGHRRALFAVEGKARIPARFAVDWVKLGPDGREFHDDGTIATNHYAYGADVLAVADGVVTASVDRFPEPTTPVSFDNEAGNYLSVDIGAGRFAVYEHLQPGSVRARVGEHVHPNDVLARAGASGSVFSGPHLHFHVSDASSPLGAEGLPFVFRTFECLGEFESLDAFAAGRPWSPRRGPAGTRRLEMPSAQAVIRFEP